MKSIQASAIPKINATNLRAIVHHIMMEANEVPMIWGQPGIGKTEVIAQALEEKDAAICDVRLGQQDTVDMRGFPGVDKKTGQTIWYAPSMLPFVGNDQWPDDRIIGLVLDEITSGLPQVLGGAYQLINERRYGEHILKPNVRIIAMGNREQDRGIVNRMPMPLLTRMVQYEMIVDVEAWAEYAATQGVPNWLIAFIMFKESRGESSALNSFNPERQDKIVALPRTWFKFAKFVRQEMPDDIRMLSCQGAVGIGLTQEAFAFKEISSKVPTIKQIIADPLKTPIPNEPSMEYAVCTKVAGEMTTKNVKPLYTYLKRMQPSFTILGWKLAGRRDESLMTTNEFLDFAQQYRDVFRAA